MNNKTNSWAVIIDTQALSEAVQRVAFTFGYEWLRVGKEVTGTGYPVLIFNPDNKTIDYSLKDQKTIGDHVCKVCVTWDQTMDCLKNPPKTKKVEDVSCVKVFDDGSILVAKTYALESKIVDQIVEVRKKLTGKKQKLPVVRFRYQSPTSGSEVRQVALMNEDDVYMSGLDLEDGNMFKLFRKDRLDVGGAIWFCGFKEV